MNKKKTKLRDVINSFIEDLDEQKDDILFEKYPEERINEIIDATIPVYNYDMIELALDNLSLAVDEPEIYGFGGQHNAVNAIAGNLYELLQEEGYEWLRKNTRGQVEPEELSDNTAKADK